MQPNEGPPAGSQDPPHPFLKRGTGTQRYKGITYPKLKTSEPRHRPSTTSSGYPSTSGYVDINVQQNMEFPNAQPSPPLAVPDSGRGSAAPQEPIYALPSNRSIESGYGGYDHSSPRSNRTSPGRGRASSADDDVFLPANEHEHGQDSPASQSMQSFIRHEQVAEHETEEESAYSTPTRQLREFAEHRKPFINNRSQSSNASNPITDDSDKGDDGPLSSTPINFPSTNQIQEQSGFNRPQLGRVVAASTISGHTSDIPSELSSATHVSRTYELRPPSDDSLSSARQLIAQNDLPLHQIFPNKHDAISGVPPSKSTQHQAHLFSKDGDLRRRALENELRKKERTNVYSTTSSDDFIQTPLRHILPKANDPVAKELRRQLRDSIAHLDLGHLHLKEQLKNVGKLRDALTNSIDRYQELKSNLEEERNNWLLEQKREFESYKKDRGDLQRREKEFQKLQSEKEEEMKAQILASRQSVAQMRTQISKKDEEIKRLTCEIESKEKTKTRLEKTFVQHKNTHNRELKKIRDENADLQKRLAQLERTSTKQKNGLHSRNVGRAPRIATSQTAQRPLPQSEPLDDSCAVDARQSQTLPLHMEHLMQGSTPRKQVQFNLDKNVIYKDMSMIDLSTFQPVGITELENGICRSFLNDKNQATYVYELKHVNGRICGAKIFKYPNNDAKWIYGPIQLYLFHRFPLVIKIPCIDVIIKIFQQCVEIHRESIDHMEISKLDREQETLTELRQRRDSAGYYTIRFSTRTGELSSIYGTHDRSQEEDMMALRRGTVQDPREYIDIKNSPRGCDVYWMSKSIPSAMVKEYYIVSDAARQTKIDITLQEEIININACPEKDWVIIRHIKKGMDIKEPCCDLGKANRDRERHGEFVAIGNIVPR